MNDQSSDRLTPLSKGTERSKPSARSVADNTIDGAVNNADFSIQDNRAASMQLRRMQRKANEYTDKLFGSVSYQNEPGVRQHVSNEGGPMQFAWPKSLTPELADQFVRKIFKEIGVDFSKDLAQPYIDRVRFDDVGKTTLTQWKSEEQALIYLRSIITESAEEEEQVTYSQLTGTYGSIPVAMVQKLVEDWGCDVLTLQMALDRITSKSGDWNYVRRLGPSSSELKLSGALKTADKRVFAGSDQVFDTIGKALH